MPKRPCPWGSEGEVPQAKVVVGPGGPRRRDKLQQVYDRTLSLLFTGARNATNNNTPERMDTCASVAPNTGGTTHFQQLILTPHGTLTRPSRGPQVSSSQPVAPSACVGCQTISTVPRPSCSYCECKLCEGCLRACHFCGGSFCPKCSLAVYLQEEKVVCLSCC